MKKKALIKRILLVYTPTVIFFLLDIACMAFAVIIAIQLIMLLVNGEDGVNKAQTLASIAATTLSFAIALTGLATFLVSYVKGFRKNSIEKTNKTTYFIKEFNDCVLNDLNIVQRILKGTSKYIMWNKSFEPLLADQKELFDEFNQHMAKKKIVYKEKLYYCCAEIFYLERDELHQNMRNFCSTIIKGKISNAGTYVRSIGANQLLYLFKRKRIGILNYFENLAVCYINEMVDTKLVDEQFKDMLIEIIPYFYYEIYRLEKIKSYPYLNKMLDIMQKK